ncbi:THAP domain-containing protein 11-like [Dreissena polymorpha]|uniref:THAP domain-containing protein 11-like n=1 Tax=Dreissena polymorpha TaxID=45954 RepID=UPI002264DF54|nr:THAP domain-containing protein 11-like [Dreissena polymorpha]
MGKKDFCCADGCSHERSRGAVCKFHKFPTDPKKRSAWLSKISRVVKVTENGKTITKPWEPSESSKLCSCHFDTPPTRSRKFSFVPSIFKHRPASTKPNRKPPKERAPGLPNISTTSTRRPLFTAIPLNSTEIQTSQAQEIFADSCDADRDFSPDASLENADIETGQIEDLNLATTLAGHDYSVAVADHSSHDILRVHEDLCEILKEKDRLQKDSDELQKLKNNGQVLSVNELKENDKLFQYYTGLKVAVFDALFKYLEPKARHIKYPHGERTCLFKHHSEVNKRKPGKNRSTSLEEEMFMTLVKLKIGLQTVDCAVRFGMSPSNYSAIFTAWVTLLSQELEKICKMPPNTECEFQ